VTRTLMEAEESGDIFEHFVIRGERESIIFLPQRRDSLSGYDLRARLSQ